MSVNLPKAAWLRIGDDDRLPILDHLGELRMRLAVCGAAYDGVGIPACVATARAAVSQVMAFVAAKPSAS